MEGLLGCAHCYVTFRGLIEAAIPELHGVSVPEAWVMRRAIPLDTVSPTQTQIKTDEEPESSPPIVSPFTRSVTRTTSPRRTRSG